VSHYDSGTINDRLASKIHELRRRTFNWDGHDTLPMRQDVFDFLIQDLLDPNFGALRAAGADIPAVRLETDGTVTILFHDDNRKILLRVACYGVILFTKLYEDGQSKSEGKIISRDLIALQLHLDELFGWLWGADPR
jgi:hypothetical protein